MNKKMKIAALVPMRHHSVRVPEKNFRLIAGKPLYHYILSRLLAVPEINQIVVDTDSEKIIEGIKKEEEEKKEPVYTNIPPEKSEQEELPEEPFTEEEDIEE